MLWWRPKFEIGERTERLEILKQIRTLLRYQLTSRFALGSGGSRQQALDVG